MKFFQKLLTLVGLRHKWIAKKGKNLEVTIHAGCGVPNYRKYKIVEGDCSKRNYDKGRYDDDGYRTIEFFKPKTNEAKILVWYTFHKTTKRYLVILKKIYNNEVKIS